VSEKQNMPADMILIKSSEPNGICYVETKNLDGETNLKYKQANPKLAEIPESDYINFEGKLQCESPNEYIYEFDGNLNIILNDVQSEAIFIDKNSFLLRGCSLQQTEYIYGLVVYVGHNSKIMKNSPSARNKVSRIEEAMNWQIFIIIIAQLVLSFTGAFVNLVMSYIYQVNHNFNQSLGRFDLLCPYEWITK